MKSIVCIGADVHSKTYSLCAYVGSTGEILGETKCAAEAKLIVKFIEKIRKDLSDECEFKVGYEAGCLGYSLHNELKALGVECEILAPTTMQRSTKNIKVKNDKMDAKNIAMNLANNSYKAVYVPTQEDVEIKEYLRMRDDTKNTFKKVKQQILALVLRHGYRYDGKSHWTERHVKWIKSLKFSRVIQETVDEYFSQYKSLQERLERFDTRIEEFSHQEKYEEKISNLKCLLGVQTTAAMTIHISTSDFYRFPNANAYMSYTGLTPGDYSSGEKNNKTGITKMGNVELRKTLVECANAISHGNVGVKSKALQARQKGRKVEVIDYADKAAERLKKKFHKMMYQGKPRNVATTAIARELAGFIWGLETGNI